MIDILPAEPGNEKEKRKPVPCLDFEENEHIFKGRECSVDGAQRNFAVSIRHLPPEQLCIYDGHSRDKRGFHQESKRCADGNIKLLCRSIGDIEIVTGFSDCLAVQRLIEQVVADGE